MSFHTLALFSLKLFLTGWQVAGILLHKSKKPIITVIERLGAYPTYTVVSSSRFTGVLALDPSSFRKHCLNVLSTALCIICL